MEFEESVDKVDSKTIVEVVKKYLTKNNSTTVILRKGKK